ncbi:hypothetical protein PENCOP_c014G04655 [Penicillium coprophilum]|uniref:Uncharacterized protein n=1 Tax=Penicillium coprophilum TaxID=36646 RepID=A0A1V6U9J6_9EURO|nr:hypothetical protein PENCOP_c014G04655 [Penicillium coprophilum]
MPYPKTSKGAHKRERSMNTTSIKSSRTPKPSSVTESFYISKDDRLCKLWPSLLRQIVSKIDHAGLCIITCVRQKAPDATNITTTILVCNSENLPHHRHISIAKIRELLNRNRLESVAIEFARGDFTRGVSDLHQEELDHRAVQLPSIISQSLALENTNSSGTFGGFVELKMPGEARYRVLGLTCFHCVCPSEIELAPDLVERIQRWRTSGIKPADHWRQKLRVRHPSSMAIKDKTQSLKAGVREIERDENYIKFRELERDNLQFTLGRGAKKTFDQMVETRNHMRGFLRGIHIFEAHNWGTFGHVFAGSGLRATSTNPSSTLDWALIKIHGQRSGYCKGKAHPLESAVLESVVEDKVIKERLTYEHSILPIQGPRFPQAGRLLCGYWHAFRWLQ